MPSYQSFGSGDIIATFNGQVVAELLSITWSVTREKAPNYVLGNTNPVGYARGRRGIAGSLVFAVFNRNALIEELRNADERSGSYEENVNQYFDFQGQDGEGNQMGYEQYMNGAGTDLGEDLPTIGQGNEFMQRAMANNKTLMSDASTGWVKDIEYADQLQPFNIVVNMANEAAEQASITLKDVEILNQGSGISIQDLAISQNYTFVARDIEEISAIDSNGAKKEDLNFGPISNA